MEAYWTQPKSQLPSKWLVQNKRCSMLLWEYTHPAVSIRWYSSAQENSTTWTPDQSAVTLCRELHVAAPFNSSHNQLMATSLRKLLKKMIARALRTDFWRIEFAVKSISENFGENRTKSEIIIRNSYYESGRKSNSSISSSWKGSSRRFHCSNAVRVGGVCGGCAKHRWLKHFPADWGLLEERRVWGTLEELEFFDSNYCVLGTVCF